MIQSRPVIGERAGYPDRSQRPGPPGRRATPRPHGAARLGLDPRTPGPRGRVARHRLAALAVFALLAAAAGLIAGVGAGDPERDLARRYAAAWERGDWRAMHGLLTTAARRRTPLAAFTRAHERAAATATALSVRPRLAGEAGEPREGRIAVPLAVATRAFGTVRADAVLPIDDDGGEARIAWARHLAFPGVRRGERLARETRLPRRATLLAADGTVLAGGEPRAGEDPELSASIAGALGPAPPERRAALAEAGVPRGAAVGLTGLERALDARLRGRPGGTLSAGGRVLGRSAPVPAGPVRSTIAPRVQRAAVAALAGRLGGVVAVDPRTGAVTAAAGIGFSGLQPPGSTFKVITLAAGLEAGLVSPRSRFPVETKTTLEGVELENANGELCGGTLTQSFAESCNTVFAPLGAKLGARRLVAAAERFGFNRPPGIPGVATSTLPPAGDIGDDLAVGSTAIGQGRVQATALQVALLSATIATGGRRPEPVLSRDDARPAGGTRATTPAVARQVARMMRAVVTEGTGTGAAVPGVAVAGKTGTAELASTVPPPSPDPSLPPPDVPETTAWFTAFAPARAPRVAVGVLLVEAGAGGEFAAPVARQVLSAAMAR